MRRRSFIKAGIAGAALTLAQGPAWAQIGPRADVTGADAKDTDGDLSIVVIGGDGSVPAKTMVDRYLGARADVWHYLPNRPAFSQILEFLDSDPRIKLAKSTKDILANKQAGKISMVVGWQDSFALEEENGNSGGSAGHRRPSCANITSWGFAPPTSATKFQAVWRRHAGPRGAADHARQVRRRKDAGPRHPG
jgi:hypothetical protein